MEYLPSTSGPARHRHISDRGTLVEIEATFQYLLIDPEVIAYCVYRAVGVEILIRKSMNIII